MALSDATGAQDRRTRCFNISLGTSVSVRHDTFSPPCLCSLFFHFDFSLLKVPERWGRKKKVRFNPISMKIATIRVQHGARPTMAELRSPWLISFRLIFGIQRETFQHFFHFFFFAFFVSSSPRKTTRVYIIRGAGNWVVSRALLSCFDGVYLCIYNEAMKSLVLDITKFFIAFLSDSIEVTLKLFFWFAHSFAQI